MTNFVKKPIEIEAEQFTGHNYLELIAWMEKGADDKIMDLDYLVDVLDTDGERINQILIQTLEGDMYANPGDWIICGIQGEFYPCKPDIFEATYDEV